jgi:hypothetical protein
MAQSSVDVQPTGTTPIAVVTQVQGGTTVNVQQVIASPGTPNTSGSLNATNIANGASATLTSSVVVTSGFTGTLQHAIFASTQATLWTLQTLNNSSAVTTVATFLTNANETYDLKAAYPTEIATVLSTGVATFQVIANNQSANANLTATAYATFFWAES